MRLANKIGDILFFAAIILFLALSTKVKASVLFADHFDSHPDWTNAQDTSLLTGESSGNWDGANASGGISIRSSHKHGDSGKGCRMKLNTSTGSTQPINLKIMVMG